MTNKKQTQEPEQNGIIDNLAKWLKENKKTVISIIVIAVIVGGIIAIVDAVREKSYQDQWSKNFIAEMAGENIKDLEEFANKYKKKPAGVYANFVLGTVLSQQKDFLKAEVFYKQALEYANDEFAPIITNTLIANTLELGDYARAITLADEFIAKNPNHFSLPQVKLYKALGLELSGDIKAAEEIYKSLGEDYPNTYYAAISMAKLAPAPEVKPEPKKGNKKAKK